MRVKRPPSKLRVRARWRAGAAVPPFFSFFLRSPLTTLPAAPSASQRRGNAERIESEGGIARVDPGHHRPRAVERGLLAETPCEEGMDAFVLEGRGPLRDERLLQKAQLSFQGEDLVEERRGAGHDGARRTAAHDPARSLAVGLDGFGSRPRSARDALGGLGRAQRIRPALERESVLPNRPDRAARPAAPPRGRSSRPRSRAGTRP